MSRSLPTPIAALLIAAASLAALALLWWPRSPDRALTRWPGATRSELQGEAQPVAVQPSTDLFDMRVDDGLYTGERDALRAELAEALAYVAERFGSSPISAITASLRRDDGCALHGVAYTDVRDTQVFSCDAIARGQAVAIMAHEFTHQLAQDRYGPAHLQSDLILSEGVATWAAGRYWLSGHPDFRSYVREQRRAGASFPLATHYAGLGTAAMNTLYYQWASFVEFLIDTYGRERFDQLYISGAGDPGSADYAGVYGKGLPELEREWERWLEG
jgi:hypothetical protein